MSWNNEEIKRKMETLTVELVNVNSVNGTLGEVAMAEKVESKLREIEYFRNNPNNVWCKKVNKDELNRKSVFALLKSNQHSDKTILFHAHTDTVTIDDFGEFKELATKPYELIENFKSANLSTDVKKDIESGEWLFGRGALDMKSGLAAHLVVLEFLSKNRDLFDGNILFMANPIEETTHGGIIDALPELERLKNEENLEFECAINTDFVGPLYNGDLTKYVYLGSVGKLLPSFYIRGKETHVAQAFEGLDPNLVASELINQINLNTDLSDEAEGEVTQPPVTLKMKDLKPTYNVQTPIASFVYFNYFVHQMSPDKILEQLKGIAIDAFQTVIDELNLQYKKYCNRSGAKYKALPWETRVITYEGLFQRVFQQHGDMVNVRLNDILVENSGKMDPREVGRLMVEDLLLLDEDKTPVIVLFFATPYVPRNFVKGKSKREKKLLDNLNFQLKELTNKTGEKFKVQKFFPSLTDSSYLCMDDTDDEINVLKGNFPGMDILYPVPIDKIRKLNIPALNLGSWGKDAHKMTERVYKPYTFSILPLLIKRFCISILSEK